MKPRTVTCSPLMVNKDSAFLSKLKIDSDEILQNLPGRTLCPSCKKSRMYYCYKCMVPVAEISDKIPRVKLPFKIDIIKHEKESEGKSTACHAAILAPDDVTIYIYPNIPNYQNKKV
ncbi:DTWD1 (predicted) [Pycnogonum litorale]